MICPHQVTFEAALQGYERQTGIALAKHPLTSQLQNCDSVDSVTPALDGQLRAFSQFRGGPEILTMLKHIALVLYRVSAITDFNQVVGLVSRNMLLPCLMFLTLII
jgi:hypothetical protein